MYEFNKDLYDFLMENETYISLYSKKVQFGVHVYLDEITDLVDILGHYILDDGGITLILNNTRTIVFELEDYFIDNNLSLEQYLDCFDESDYSHYMDKIKEFDKE